MTKAWTDFSISSILNLGACTMKRPGSECYSLELRNTITIKENSTDDLTKRDSSDECSNSPPRKKKSRTVFTRQQIQHLENAFDRKKYFTNSERQKLASDLMLSETQVKIWLQNRRNKWKKQIQSDSSTSPPYTQSNYGKMLHGVNSPILQQRSTSDGKQQQQATTKIFRDKNENFYYK